MIYDMTIYGYMIYSSLNIMYTSYITSLSNYNSLKKLTKQM